LTKFVICTPVYGDTKKCYDLSLIKTLEVWPKTPYVRIDVHFTHIARYMCVMRVKQLFPDADGILWIDSDMEWQPADVTRIVSDKHRALGAVYRSRTDEGYLVKYADQESGHVESIGFGFIYTPMHFFPNEMKPWFQTPWINEKEEFMGEDVYFCMNAFFRADSRVFKYPKQEDADAWKIFAFTDHTVRHWYEPGPRGLYDIKDLTNAGAML
jgi:hypothetical protein